MVKGSKNLTNMDRIIDRTYIYLTKGSYPIEKATKLGNLAFRGGVVKKSKKSQVSVGNSSKLGGGSSEIKKVPSSRGYQD